MKVVLRQDVPKLGESGSIQDVKPGYGRNYLIPQGLAVLATPGEVKTAEHNAAVKARKVVRQEQLLQDLADKISGKRLEFTVRAGEGGRLYGSITSAEIADELAKVKVTAEIIENLRGPKIVIQKFKNKTGYKKRQGYRSELTKVKVTSIA